MQHPGPRHAAPRTQDQGTRHLLAREGEGLALALPAPSVRTTAPGAYSAQDRGMQHQLARKGEFQCRAAACRPVTG